VGCARQIRAAVVLSTLLAVCPHAFALDPSLDVSQYAHKAWTIREGSFESPIRAIAQTPDGYLWLGTETGLLRFDGVQAVSWTPPHNDPLPSASVFQLLVSRDGTLWIGTSKGLASWDGANLTRYRDLDQQYVASLLEDREGTVWAGSLAATSGRLCAIRQGGTKCYGQDGSLGRMVLSLYQDDAGQLWAGAETGLWRWRPGPPQLYPVPHTSPYLEIRDLNRTEDGQLLLATNEGIKRFADGRVQPYRIPGLPLTGSPHRFLRDRDGGLWIGTTAGGILHVHQGRTNVFARTDGLSDDPVAVLFEDREGSVWAATNGGLDRFGEFAVPTVSTKQGLSNDSTWSVAAARNGDVWVGTRGGLNRWDNGQVTIFRNANGLPDDAPQSLFEDDAGRIWLSTPHGLGFLHEGVYVPAASVPGWQIHGIAGDGAGALWLSEDRNLLRVAGGRVVEQIPWSHLGSDEDAHVLLPGGGPGGLWLAFRTGRGVIYWSDGQVQQSFRAADGLGEGSVAGLKLDPDGSLWAATEGGLSLIRNGRVSALTAKNGLPCDTVHWVMDDDVGSTWLYMPCGLARLDRKELDSWKADPKRSVHPVVFGSSDGVMLTRERSGYSPRVSKSPDGKLWYVTEAGVQVINPRHLPFNKLPPPVHIEQVIANHEAVSNMRLPALTRDLEIDYTALSLVAPEKNRFKYKLEGHDREWIDAGNRRQAFYSDLPPRKYRFRVIASNNSGVWNETGDTLEFSIAPAYYQTNWFRALIAALVFGAAWGLYRYRLYQIAREFSVRLEERVSERTRLARDLHDTLLQSFHGLMLRFQAVSRLLPDGKAKEQLEQTLERADQAIAEGRSAVYDLRSSTTETNELSEALTAVGNELSKEDAAEFSLVVEGEARDLHPIIRDELYRIAREALSNAFKHAHARHVEAEIEYGERLFRLRIRDDGEGIPTEILDQGRPGHYGLPGIRERARQVGSDLTIWSRAHSGTEIDLSLAASIAYGRPPRQARFQLFGKKVG
jgi:signal transduction histidine kinase/ligand-binding sensor domain-containing protein